MCENISVSLITHRSPKHNINANVHTVQV